MEGKGLDYVLKIGADYSSLKDANKDIVKVLSPSLEKVEKSEAKTKVLKEKNLALTQKQIILAKRQVAIEAQIKRAERRGGSGFESVRQLSGKGTKESILEAELVLKRKLLHLENRLKDAEKARKDAKAATVKVEKPKRDPDEMVSYASRTILQDKINRNISRDFSGSITRPDLQERAKFAQSRMAGLKDRLDNTKSFKELTRIKGDYQEIQNELAQVVSLQRAHTRELSNSVSMSTKLAKNLRAFAYATVGAYAAVNAAVSVYNTGKELDSLQASLLAASGSAEKAQEDFKFLEKTTQDLGKTLPSMVGGYNKIAIAARLAGFSAEESKDIFLAAAEASTAYGLSQERTELVMLAFSQILSKGKVSMEELSTQLGEHLHGAVALGAKAMGYSSDEVGKFIKEIGTGQTTAKGFMTKFSKTLREEVTESGALAAGKKKLTAEQQRLQASYQSMINKVFQNGGAKSLSEMFQALNESLKDNEKGIQGVIGILIDFVAATVHAGLAVWDLVKAGLDLSATFLTLGQSKDGISYLVGMFYDLLAVVYKTIAGLHVLKDLVSFNFKDAGRFFSEAQVVSLKAERETFNRLAGNLVKRAQEAKAVTVLKRAQDMFSSGSGDAASSGKKIDIQKIEYNSYNSDPKQSMTEFDNYLQGSFGSLFSS